MERQTKDPAVCPSCGKRNTNQLDVCGVHHECYDCGIEYTSTVSQEDWDRYASVRCSICGKLASASDAHVHQGGWIGDECCWEERLRRSE